MKSLICSVKKVIAALAVGALLVVMFQLNHDGHSLYNLGLWDGYSLANNILTHFVLLPLAILAACAVILAAFGVPKKWWLLPAAFTLVFSFQRVYFLFADGYINPEQPFAPETCRELLDQGIQLAACLLIAAGGLALLLKWTKRCAAQTEAVRANNSRVCACAAAIAGVLVFAAGFASEQADAYLNKKVFRILDAYGDTYPMPEAEIAELDAFAHGLRLNPVSDVQILYRGAGEPETAYHYETDSAQSTTVDIYSTDRPAWQLALSLARESDDIVRFFNSAALSLLLLSGGGWCDYFIRRGKAGGEAVGRVSPT